MPTHPYRNFVLVGLALAVVLVAGYFLTRPSVPTEQELLRARATVESFGRSLQKVPLLGDAQAVADAMQQHYAPYVATGLLRDWKKDPSQAPGRFTSSPWPDRIEVSEVLGNSDRSATARGSIIEITSDSMTGGTPPQAYVIEARLKRTGSNWKIVEFRGGPDHTAQ